MHFPKFLRLAKLVTLVIAAAFGALVFAGCGGGGGGGGSSSNTKVTVTGTLVIKGTSTPLSGYTVTISGTSLAATSNSSGVFSIANVPDGTTISLVITDSANNTEGSPIVYNLNSYSATNGVKNLGNVPVDLTTPPPPPGI